MGAWTPEVVLFQKISMSKGKNLDPWGACVGHAPSRSANVESTSGSTKMMTCECKILKRKATDIVSGMPC